MDDAFLVKTIAPLATLILVAVPIPWMVYQVLFAPCRGDSQLRPGSALARGALACAVVSVLALLFDLAVFSGHINGEVVVLSTFLAPALGLALGIVALGLVFRAKRLEQASRYVLAAAAVAAAGIFLGVLFVPASLFCMVIAQH
ncbi:MAG TPA: hypothetical protein VGM19_03470 [Armatimonadota bacterium]|jgi:hypothetical protein